MYKVTFTKISNKEFKQAFKMVSAPFVIGHSFCFMDGRNARRIIRLLECMRSLITNEIKEQILQEINNDLSPVYQKYVREMWDYHYKNHEGKKQ